MVQHSMHFDKCKYHIQQFYHSTIYLVSLSIQTFSLLKSLTCFSHPMTLSHVSQEKNRLRHTKSACLPHAGSLVLTCGPSHLLGPPLHHHRDLCPHLPPTSPTGLPVPPVANSRVSLLPLSSVSPAQSSCHSLLGWNIPPPPKHAFI